MVEDDLPNSLFLLQHCLLALLCQLKGKKQDISEGKNKQQNLLLIYLYLVRFIFYVIL